MNIHKDSGLLKERKGVSQKYLGFWQNEGVVLFLIATLRIFVYFMFLFVCERMGKQERKRERESEREREIERERG